MNDASAPKRWFSVWRRRERPVEDDPADMGTAFGLDLSVEPLGAAPAAPAVAKPATVPWAQRLALRRKPAA